MAETAEKSFFNRQKHWCALDGGQRKYRNRKRVWSAGHGGFTYSLLQALQRKALNNKMITVNGPKNYLQEIVPDQVRKYGSRGQYPASYGFGNDFPLEVVNE